MITVLLVEDHRLVRDALKLVLNASGDICVSATAANGWEAIDQVMQECPQVVVLDVSMPGMDGIETARNLRVICPNTRILMLSMYNTFEYVVQALNAGAHGYLLKDNAGVELINAVRVLHSGENYFSPRIARLIGEL